MAHPDTPMPQDATTMTAMDPEAWSRQNPRGSAVLWYPEGDRTAKPQSAVVKMTGYRTTSGGYLTAISPDWKRVPIEHLAPHPLREQLTALDKPDGGELDWIPPDCPHCGVPTSYDDGPSCDACGTYWEDSGGAGTRLCVECEEDAHVVGGDGQPRCSSCQLAVITGEFEPTPPYECRTCHKRVVGIGDQRDPGKACLCAACHHRVESDRWWADYQARKASGES